MADKAELLQAIAKRLAAKTITTPGPDPAGNVGKQFGNLPPRITNDQKQQFVTKMQNSARAADMQELNDPQFDTHTSKLIDDATTPTQSEIQDIRGVPDPEFDSVNARTSSPLQYLLREKAVRNSSGVGDTRRSNREVAPPNEPTSSIEDDPRFKETSSRLRELMQLRKRVEAGKFATRPGEKDTLDKLINQQSTEYQNLIKEMMDEGLR